MTAAMGSAFILSSVGPEPGPAIWLRAGASLPGWWSGWESLGCWVLGAGAGIAKDMKTSHRCFDRTEKDMASCPVFGG